MTTWTALSNSAVGIGGLPSGATVTALRDNPVAVAEGATGAPLLSSGWHPYDAVTVGDGVTGELWSFAADGVVQYVTTPTLEAGYDYKLICLGISFNGTSNQFTFNGYLTTNAAWPAASAGFGMWDIPTTASYTVDAEFVVERPMIARLGHTAIYTEPPLISTGITASRATVYVGFTGNPIIHNTRQTVSMLRFGGNTNSMDAGAIYLHRRKNAL